MPSVSKAQQRFMGLVHAYKKGEVPASKVSKAVKDAAKSMKTKSTKKYASTKHKGLPNKVRQEAEDKLKEIIRMELEACGYTTSAMNPEYDLKSPGGTGEEDKELKENIECLCEACQKGYMTHPTRKTKIMFGKRYRNCIKKENVTEDGHTDVASAERKLKIIMKDALETLNQLRTLSNEGELPSWWTDKITLAKDYVSKSRDYIMNPAESVDERISVSDERHFGKKGIIIMIDDNGKKISAIFKDKKNAKEFNRNKPADIKKLLKLAKKTKYPKAIDEALNEKTISIGGKDLMKYLMKRFKMSKSQAIASMKKHKMDMSFLKKESVYEAVEPRGNIKKVLDVAKNKQAKKIGGTLVDGTTANMMTQVWNKVNDSSKEKMNKMNTKQLINLILRMWKAMGTPRV